MANDFGPDLQDILNVISSADVLIVRFQIVEQRLLVDARHNQLDGPMICLVPRAKSVEERFQSLKRLRPRFAMPERIMSFWWPRHVASLHATGVWPRIRERLAESGFPEIGRRCDEVFRELALLELRETTAAIRGGDGFQTLWERRG